MMSLSEAIRRTEQWRKEGARQPEAMAAAALLEHIEASVVPRDAGRLKAALRTLTTLGYTYHGGGQWTPPVGQRHSSLPADELSAPTHAEVQAAAQLAQALTELKQEYTRDFRRAISQPSQSTGQGHSSCRCDAAEAINELYASRLKKLLQDADERP